MKINVRDNIEKLDEDKCTTQNWKTNAAAASGEAAPS